jgi:exodeoxyribonuclease VII small subunit
MSEKKAKPIAAELQELDELIAWFDQPDFDLDEAVAKFTQGMELAESVKEHLAQLENTITILKQRFDVPEA